MKSHQVRALISSRAARIVYLSPSSPALGPLLPSLHARSLDIFSWDQLLPAPGLRQALAPPFAPISVMWMGFPSLCLSVKAQESAHHIPCPGKIKLDSHRITKRSLSPPDSGNRPEGMSVFPAGSHSSYIFPPHIQQRAGIHSPPIPPSDPPPSGHHSISW